jgi:hypothetical protein
MKIYQAINSIMNEMEAIEKGKKNSQQGFMYRGVDDVMNTLKPLLAKHKVFVVPKVLEETREERTTAKGGLLLYSVLKIEYSFYAEDGSCVSAVVIGEGMDSGDKASNKAMSVAFKYACFQVFCIPTEDMVDPDSHTPEPSVKHFSLKERAKIISDLLKQSNGSISFEQVDEWIVKKFGSDKNLENITDQQFITLKNALDK